jgi:hypothetical protein
VQDRCDLPASMNAGCWLRCQTFPLTTVGAAGN